MGPLDPVITALFSAFASQAGAQIARFARSFAGEKIGLAVEREKSDTARIERLGRELREEGKITDALFDVLASLRPEVTQLIEDCRSEWHSEQARWGAEATDGDAPSPSPAARTDDPWLTETQALLDGAGAALGPPPVYVEAAALLASFDPTRLMLLDPSDASKQDALVHMAKVVDVRGDGRWVLKRSLRRDAIALLVREARLDRAFRDAQQLFGSAEDLGDDPHLRIVADVVNGRHMVPQVDTPQADLLAARDVADWFAGSGLDLIAIDRVATIIAARDKIEPLRKLTANFRGRREELALLEGSQADGGFGPERARVLALTGIGGTGKSALIGQYLLALTRQAPTPPWVYIDFDRAEADPANPRKLIELVARNLGLLYAGLESSRQFYSLEAASAGDMPIEDVVPADADETQLLELLMQRLRMVSGDGLLLVFDTFEQVMVRGPSVVGHFSGWLERLLAALPDARVIISGRGEIMVPVATYPLKLADLDHESADAVLEARGVGDPLLRGKIINEMGRSPLALRLASDALASGELAPGEVSLFGARARGLKLQGQLYTRVLGHIKDPEVERLAHPGLIVRRVTPSVIREVLAEVCKIDPGHADEIFKRLPNHMALFERASASGALIDEHDALWHRQDLRELVIELMLSDPRWKDVVPRIHWRAVDYYHARSGPVAQAEELYHRLMLDDDPNNLDVLWSDAIAPSLARSWGEPIPPRAREWLGFRLGYDWSSDTSGLRTIDWEVRAVRSVRSFIDSGDLDGAIELVNERTDRSPDSPLVPVEVDLLRRAGRHKLAIAKSEEAIARAESSDVPAYRVSLHLLAAEIALEDHDTRTALAHAEQAQALASALADEAARMHALELIVRARPARENVHNLERAFVATPTRKLRTDEAMAARIVEIIGGSSNAVMRKAAQTFGDLPQQRILSRDPAQWRSLFDEVAKYEEGERLLTVLAPRVGLSSADANPVRLATSVIRHNRQGETLSSVLDVLGDRKQICTSSLALFKSGA